MRHQEGSSSITLHLRSARGRLSKAQKKSHGRITDRIVQLDIFVASSHASHLALKASTCLCRYGRAEYLSTLLTAENALVQSWRRFPVPLPATKAGCGASFPGVVQSKPSTPIQPRLFLLFETILPSHDSIPNTNVSQATMNCVDPTNKELWLHLSHSKSLEHIYLHPDRLRLANT